MDFDKIAPAFAISLVITLFSLGVAKIILKTNLENECLLAGYREARMTLTLKKFCIKRVDQTDVVVPYFDIKK